MRDPNCALGVNLRGRRVVFVGGCPAIEQKLLRLLDFEARLVVFSPECTNEIRHLAERGEITWERRPAEPTDFQGTFLVFLGGAGGDSASNEVLAQAARAQGALVNRADRPDDCDFVLPALSWMNSVHIGVFSESPALSKWVRRHLERTLGAEFSEFVGVFSTIRDRIRQQDLTSEERSEILSRLLNEGLYEVYRSEGIAAALARADGLVREHRRAA